MVRITTWNVNGIRNPFGYQPWRENRTFTYMFDVLEADIVIMQELKIQRKDLRDDMVLVNGWDCYFSLPKHKKGYSGVGIYTRQSVCAPIRAEEGLLGVLCSPGSSAPYRELPEDQCIGGYPTASQIEDLGVDPAVLDAEGRCMVLEFPAFVLFGVYSPANSNGQRDDFRYGFICALDARIRNLEKMGKRVVLTGDLNVSREPIDTARAEEAMREEGLTFDDYQNAPNRRIFNQLLEHGKVPGERDEGREKPVLWDICREFHPTREGMYTHWEQKINARPGNFGSRIDYVLCSISMKTWFEESNIQEGLMGSDHCPVYAKMKDVVQVNGEDVHTLDIMNPPWMFKEGNRLMDYNPTKHLRPLSGKLIPEFDKRRSIKDMFTKKPKPSNTESDFDVPSNTTSATLSVPVIESQLLNEPSTQNSFPSQFTVSMSPSMSPDKRRSTSSVMSRPAKRAKSNLGATGTGKGQQSLKGFFSAKPPKVVPENEPEEIPQATDTAAASPFSTAPDATVPPPTPPPDPSADPSADPSPSAPPTPDTTHYLYPIDAQQTKASWTQIFSKRPPPRCEGHNEPCISLQTKKPGANNGRSFWICPRPIGPSGQKERGTQWRCGTFIWGSDVR
ncbi:DNase I-like protein [Amniculicola lignicola CBS 123094]|uniref:DNA-(apurinic or apyrimidinic site) endonuclease 2 n=1 Tax=Amniculicola lignicola CBS 123094 TaxID=1392246 RepID=A0A6A5WT88_9PLEO|nr:DNase I-like protein [Amniculicola lignicola CBS 123094]